MPRLFKITVNGTDYDVAVDELTDITSQIMPKYTASSPVSSVQVAAPAASSSAPAPAGAGDQCAQMGGVVASILVKEGQAVNEGDKIVELEAMKMKVPVIASCTGKVSRILVAVGDGVENGQVLVTIA
jgi:biotin carboxyl carrier protein